MNQCIFVSPEYSSAQVLKKIMATKFMPHTAAVSLLSSFYFDA